MTIRSSLALNVAVLATNDLDLGNSRAQRAITAAIDLTNGVGAGQADRVFADTRTLAASAAEDLDLSGTLLDAFGAAVVFARVKALVIKADAANTNNVVLSRPAANGVPLFSAASDAVAVRPGGLLVLACGAADVNGYVVTAATGDLINLANSGAGTPVTYSIIVIGASA
jgi:hypothetical protein